MKNADMPAMPTEDIQGAERKGADPFGNYTHAKHKSHGLTKRETVLKDMMCAVVNAKLQADINVYTATEMAEIASKLTDAYFKELEK